MFNIQCLAIEQFLYYIPSKGIQAHAILLNKVSEEGLYTWGLIFQMDLLGQVDISCLLTVLIQKATTKQIRFIHYGVQSNQKENTTSSMTIHYGSKNRFGIV